MATNTEVALFLESVNTLKNLGIAHSSLAANLDVQTKIVSNTAEQLVNGYKIYGLENNISENFSSTSIPGFTAPKETLEDPEESKLVIQPFTGHTLDERLVFFGHKPPGIKSETIGKPGNLTDPAVGSILPWTPHPQHSYKLNSTRVINRTGKARPEVPSQE